LRDYARLGRLLAHDGAWEGRQLIPRQWVLDATTVKPADAHLAPGTATPYFGYGYQVWLLPGEQRRFALLGIRGQIILVDPAPNSSWSIPPFARYRRNRALMPRRLRCGSPVLGQLGR
jgi:CubicO group peptidase (beta-lactamase class C family)